MSEQKGEKRERVISKEEEDFIVKNFTGPSLFPMGILGHVRQTGESLDVAIRSAVENPTSPEQKSDWEKAGKFITENAERFGLERQNPDQGK